MSAPLPAKVIGAVLLGAALAGIAVLSFFPSAVARQGASVPEERADTQWTAARAAAAAGASGAAADTSMPLRSIAREETDSPFSPAGSDTVAARCVAKVREISSEGGADTSGVAVDQRIGVRPPPGRGPDSLVVEGTAPGRDSIRAVWHCAATARSREEAATLTAVVEDGWAGVPARFELAHVVTANATDACLQRAKKIYREYDFRGVKLRRVADTLHVTGEAMPLNSEDLAGDFHCRAIVRGGRVVSTQAKAER